MSAHEDAMTVTFGLVGELRALQSQRRDAFTLKGRRQQDELERDIVAVKVRIKAAEVAERRCPM